MGFNAMRRRLLAGAAILGATGMLPSLARAQGDAAPAEDAAPVPDMVQTPCSTTVQPGSYASPSNAYSTTATEASLLVVAHIAAKGDNIVLFAEAALGGIHTDGLALVKANVSRKLDESRFSASQVSFEWPLTALSQAGQYYSIVQMAYEQKAPVGLVFYADDAELLQFEFKPGEVDPNKRDVVFTGLLAQQLFDQLLGPARFRADLMVGGTAYSSFDIEAGRFAGFVNGPLLAAMNAMAEQDRTAPCSYDANADALGDCFLTSACCAVIGLADRCWELETLRRFRDGWMSGFAAGRSDIARYYAEAPAVARRLAASPAGRARLLRLYWTVIVPAAALARLGANRLAYGLYRRMMMELLGERGA